MVLKWLRPPQKKPTRPLRPDDHNRYFITGGASIEARLPGLSPPLSLDAGARLALIGHDTYRKHWFCDWILGFAQIPGSSVSFQVGEKILTQHQERMEVATVLGRSNLLPSHSAETLQESLLFRTSNVRKQDLHYFVERFYGPNLRKRTSPQNPFADSNDRPILTQSLSAREKIEVAEINLLLQKPSLLILDFSSALMQMALSEGYKPREELFTSGKTVIAIAPTGRDLNWLESLTGALFSSSLNLDSSELF